MWRKWLDERANKTSSSKQHRFAHNDSVLNGARKTLDKGSKRHYIIYNQTVDAEITVIMFLQRACGAESQAENKSSNGPLRVQSKGACLSILQRTGTRELPGIYWYPVKRTDFSVNQGGTADKY
jgi:hypothetical protein